MRPRLHDINTATADLARHQQCTDACTAMRQWISRLSQLMLKKCEKMQHMVMMMMIYYAKNAAKYKKENTSKTVIMDSPWGLRPVTCGYISSS